MGSSFLVRTDSLRVRCSSAYHCGPRLVVHSGLGRAGKDALRSRATLALAFAKWTSNFALYSPLNRRPRPRQSQAESDSYFAQERTQFRHKNLMECYRYTCLSKLYTIQPT